MYIETQIKQRQTVNTNWAPDSGAEYLRVLTDIFRYGQRLINLLVQDSEDQLQRTRIMLFRSKSDRDGWFGDPIVNALEKQAANYELINHISARTITEDTVG